MAGSWIVLLGVLVLLLLLVTVVGRRSGPSARARWVDRRGERFAQRDEFEKPSNEGDIL